MAAKESAVKAFSAVFDLPLNTKAVLTRNGLQNVDTSAGLFGLTSQQPFVFQLLKQVPITASYVSDWRENGSYIDVADVGAENSEAPEEGTWTATQDNLPVRKIFSTARATDELISDQPVFSDFINERLVRSVLQRLDAEVINGSGLGSHLKGILASGPTVIAKGALSRSDALLTALSRVRSIGFGAPNAIIMNHADALALQTDKATGDAYTASLPGNYTDRSQPIYAFGGAPVLQTAAIAAGNVLVGDFSGAILFMRRELRVETTEFDGDSWSNNIISIMASLRAVLLVHTPTKFVSITGF